MIAHAAAVRARLLEKGGAHLHHRKVGRVGAHGARHGRVRIAEQLIAARVIGGGCGHRHADHVRREAIVRVGAAQRHMPRQEERGQLGAELAARQAVHDKVDRVVRVHENVDQRPQNRPAVRVEFGEERPERAAEATRPPVDLGARVQLHPNDEQHDR